MNRLLLVVLCLVTLSSVQLGQSQCDGKSKDCHSLPLLMCVVLLYTVTRITASVYEVLRPILSEIKEDIRSVKSDIVNEMATINQRVSNHTEEVDARLSSLNESMRDVFNGVERELSIVNTTANMICEEQTNQITTELMGMEQILTKQIINNRESIHDTAGLKCGGTWGWRRAVYLDMTDPNTNCPSGWNMTGYSKRTCGRASTGWRTCDSVFFPVSGGPYSQVCGRIRAYQWGSPIAFYGYNHGGQSTTDSAYVSGVAVVHGIPRQHIWTFAAGYTENYPWYTGSLCPCDTTGVIPIPSFVGEDYFCESGYVYNNGALSSSLYSNDTLWDGRNCHSTSTCCSLHNPPYFTKTLNHTTTNNLELRMCFHDPSYDDNIAVELVELYVK